ncbi:UDP-N-acetylmuramoyl-tripeptide--D-alanyl-D-alanine ligase [Deltaproteobacteria bacterium]|nr:UDP-N-acetylmuramoyl-tripeptide--D-alanyl-D-alanine ligase [Deltaproteobacteria bacterium]
MSMTLIDTSRFLKVVVVGMKPKTGVSRPTGAAIDSRAVKKGNLFFCLQGEKVDGHDFAGAAVEKGAIAIIASHDPFPGQSAPVPVMIVPDVTDALIHLAKKHRESARGTVIAVTGTSGKTTVKEVLASVLARSGKTAKNELNHNNRIGLPLSMLNASSNAAFWVMEIGISRPGDMDELGSILQPDVGLIINADMGHTQELGDKGTAFYKARLLAHLAKHGQAVVSADYTDLVRQAETYGVPLTYFATLDDRIPYHAHYLGPKEGSFGAYTLSMEGRQIVLDAPFQGSYGAENVAAIGAVAHTLGLTDTEIVEGFAVAKLPQQRFSRKQLGAFTLIDDSYNANPLSMSRMLDAAADAARSRKENLLLVLGEMGELGADSAKCHYALGRHVAKLAPGFFCWKGGMRAEVERGLHDAGYTGSCYPVTDAASFVKAYESGKPDKGVILFKGSRVNRMEELVAAFAATRRKGKGNAL